MPSLGAVPMPCRGHRHTPAPHQRRKQPHRVRHATETRGRNGRNGFRALGRGVLVTARMTHRALPRPAATAGPVTIRRQCDAPPGATERGTRAVRGAGLLRRPTQPAPRKQHARAPSFPPAPPRRVIEHPTARRIGIDRHWHQAGQHATRGGAARASAHAPPQGPSPGVFRARARARAADCPSPRRHALTPHVPPPASIHPPQDGIDWRSRPARGLLQAALSGASPHPRPHSWSSPRCPPRARRRALLRPPPTPPLRETPPSQHIAPALAARPGGSPLGARSAGGARKRAPRPARPMPFGLIASHREGRRSGAPPPRPAPPPAPPRAARGTKLRNWSRSRRGGWARGAAGGRAGGVSEVPLLGGPEQAQLPTLRLCSGTRGGRLRWRLAPAVAEGGARTPWTARRGAQRSRAGHARGVCWVGTHIYVLQDRSNEVAPNAAQGECCRRFEAARGGGGYVCVCVWRERERQSLLQRGAQRAR